MNNSIKKWAKGLNRHHIEEDMQMENKHIKRRSTLYVIRELQMKVTIRYCYTPMRMAKIQNTNNIQSQWGCEEIGIIICCWWEHEMVQSLQKSTKGFLQNTLTIQSSNHASWYLLKWVENLCPYRSLHGDIYGSFIHNCQNLEATKMSFSKWMDK